MTFLDLRDNRIFASLKTLIIFIEPKLSMLTQQKFLESYVIHDFLQHQNSPGLRKKNRVLCTNLLLIYLLSQTLFGNPKGPVELGNPNTCAETKLCLNFILFRLKK